MPVTLVALGYGPGPGDEDAEYPETGSNTSEGRGGGGFGCTVTNLFEHAFVLLSTASLQPASDQRSGYVASWPPSSPTCGEHAGVPVACPIVRVETSVAGHSRTRRIALSCKYC